MMTLKILVPLFASLLLVACNQDKTTEVANDKSPAKTEQTDHAHHSSHADALPHSLAYDKSMQSMATQMSAAYQAVNGDVAFMQGMIAHHVGAVEMAKVQLEHGKDDTLKQLAQKIIDTQMAEIASMQAWLTKNQPNAKPDPNMPQITERYQTADKKYHDLMMAGMMAHDADTAFVQGMIPHHQGAIAMADIVLSTTQDQEIIALAHTIKSAQTPEIEQMQAWLAHK